MGNSPKKFLLYHPALGVYMGQDVHGTPRWTGDGIGNLSRGVPVLEVAEWAAMTAGRPDLWTAFLRPELEAVMVSADINDSWASIASCVASGFEPWTCLDTTHWGM